MLKRKEFILGAAAGLTLAAAATAGGVITWPGAHAEPQAVNRITPVPANGDAFTPPPGAPSSFATIFDQVSPAVVQIDVTVKVDQPQGGAFQIPGLPFQFVPPQGRGGQGNDEPQTTQGAGSGFFISQDGFIVTNNHVVADATEIKVKMSDGRELPARLIGRDEATDLAVIKVEGNDFKYVSFEETADPRVGDWVIAVGNPFGLGGTATAGIVSAKARNLPGAESAYTDFLQIDAAINRGNSGGPTFDIHGRVIGVNSAIYSPTGGSVGIGFAIPAEVAKQITSRLMRGETIERGYLGVQISTPNEKELGALGLPATQKGALVASVTENGPAARAGLRFSDVIVSLNGEPIDSSTKLTRLVGAAAPGDTLRMEIIRDGRRQMITARSAMRPSESELNRQEDGAQGFAPNEGAGASVTVEGLNLTPLTPILRQRLGVPATVDGLAVTGVEEGVDPRLSQGVVIQQVQNTPVRTVGEFRAAIDAVKASSRPGAYLLLWVKGTGNVPYVLDLSSAQTKK
ncbi:trypsin-like peptidase domain-containing protein [Brevundimonas fontaquae]|uniref:Trypsin-like peptidase domain-containing protein n=1 Tax=Brevundimonas fontaquae TaxID=2813778 RepID=A0ABX7LSY5_9CAUL|nr:trypsin-like peptidase domain-containing protein [Brevundimonas fontaquae]QSF55244.1 trypsin-like peptidase domain-containing protein [Brevundimonas fontaquae]